MPLKMTTSLASGLTVTDAYWRVGGFQIDDHNQTGRVTWLCYASEAAYTAKNPPITAKTYDFTGATYAAATQVPATQLLPGGLQTTTTAYDLVAALCYALAMATPEPGTTASYFATATVTQ